MIADDVGWWWTGHMDQPSPVLDLAGVVGVEGWARLPPAVQRRFTVGCAAARYSGTMDLGRSGAGLIFAAVSALVGGPLPLRRATGVAAEVQVRRRGSSVTWDRSLHCPGGTVLVRSTKQAAGDGTVLERTAGCLGMVLDVFEDAGTLVFQSRRYVLCVGRWRLTVPAWLTPGQCRVEHRALGPSTFRFTLVMQHPLLGRTFWQAGLFTDPNHTETEPQENRP